jgi:hypothetical protein
VGGFLVRKKTTLCVIPSIITLFCSVVIQTDDASEALSFKSMNCMKNEGNILRAIIHP